MAKPLSSAAAQEFLPHELGELRKHIEGLPRSVRENLLPLCDKICHFIYLQGRLFEMAQETADRLHLEVKYLMFDLDVTQKERDELLHELEHYTGGEGW